jgi:hypothetical protein
MAFTLSGSTITQTGTDTSLSGLAGIAGVTTISQGDLKIYSLPALNLVIQGDLTINPRFEQLFMGAASPFPNVQNSGTLNINSRFTSNGETSYYDGFWLRTTRKSDVAWNDSQLSFINYGTFNWNGGSMQVFASAALWGTKNIADGEIVCEETTNQTARIYSNSSISNIRFVRNGVNLTSSNITLSGLSFINAGVFGVHGDVNSITLVDYDYVANGVIFPWGANKLWTASNPVRGTALQFATGDPSWNSTLVVTKNVSFNISDAVGAAVSGGVVYTRDTNNGARRSNATGQNFTADRVHVASTDASGVASITNMLIGVFNATNPVDYRGLDNSATDRFRFNFLAYGCLSASTIQVLKGKGTLSIPWTLFSDTNVTLTEANAIIKLGNSFTVSTTGAGTITVTASSTLDDIYDALKAWKTRPVQAQLEFPSIGVQPVRGVGTALQTDMAIVINAGVTVSAGAKFKTLATTATVSGSGSITAPYTDANNAGSITVSGLGATDTADMRKASDNSLIASRTGNGSFAVSPANIGVSVYFERKAGAALVMSTITTPVVLAAGVNADVQLYAGSQVQVVQAAELVAIKAKTDQLQFTVAGQVDANIQYVNDVQVAGTGAAGNAWRPV